MRMVIELSDELHERFKAKTAQDGFSMAGLVREWVGKYSDGRIPAQNVQIRAPKSSEAVPAPTNAQEAQRRRDELLRKTRKGK